MHLQVMQNSCIRLGLLPDFDRIFSSDPACFEVTLVKSFQLLDSLLQAGSAVKGLPQGQDVDHGQTSTNCVIHHQSMPSAAKHVMAF